MLVIELYARSKQQLCCDSKKKHAIKLNVETLWLSHLFSLEQIVGCLHQEKIICGLLVLSACTVSDTVLVLLWLCIHIIEIYNHKTTCLLPMVFDNRLDCLPLSCMMLLILL